MVTESTIEAVKRREALGKSCWRVSSTLFAHIAYDKIMQPVGPFRNEVSLKQYPPVNAGNFVRYCVIVFSVSDTCTVDI